MPKLPNPPIIEAILDIDCDMPAVFDLAEVEELAAGRLRERYPKKRKKHLQSLEIEIKDQALRTLPARHAVQALQFLEEDEKQLVQLRAQGFSFNRLTPYSGLDDYLPEIERTWRLYSEIASPVEIRAIRLRYINKIILPMDHGKVELDEYFEVAPHLPLEDALQLTGFLNQHSAVESKSGNEVNLVLASQPPEDDGLPVILDIAVAKTLNEEPGNWPAIRATVDSLRRLKNDVFYNTVNKRCLQLFQ